MSPMKSFFIFFILFMGPRKVTLLFIFDGTMKKFFFFGQNHEKFLYKNLSGWKSSFKKILL